MSLVVLLAAALLQQGASAEGGSSEPGARPARVTIDAYDRRIEGWRSPEDQAYEATVLGGAAVAQSRRGDLDGKWVLTGPEGAALFAFLLVDPGYGYGVEGAWRDLDAGSSIGRSGFIALIGREAAATTLRFLEPGASAPTVVTLEPGLDGSWRGQMVREGATAPVVMRRR